MHLGKIMLLKEYWSLFSYFNQGKFNFFVLFTHHKMRRKGKLTATRNVVEHLKGKLKEVENPELEQYNLNPSFIFNSTLKTRKEGMMRWEEIFDFFGNREWLKSIIDSHPNINHLEGIRKIELHSIASRDKIFPYCDMISWILAHVDIPK